MRRSLICVVVTLVVGCGPTKMDPQPPAKIHTTYRVLGGVSMGAIGTAALGSTHPDEFDGLAPLGGPMDAAFFTHVIDTSLLGGFCPRARLEELARTAPASLNDPKVIEACLTRLPRIKYEHQEDFNHWKGLVGASTFDRDSYTNLLTDLLLAFGNIFTDNPASDFAPPGTDIAKIRNPPADFCTNPMHVRGLFNAEYNPDGTKDAITFCDGQPNLYYCHDTKEQVDFCSDPRNIATPLPVSQELAFANTFCMGKGGAVLANENSDGLFVLDHMGINDPCRVASKPVRAMLAYDYNGNGRRDYGEPIVNNGRERFDDFGVDGCPDSLENGSGGCTTTANPSAVDPNHDNFDLDSNFGGTENDFKRQDGEPFRDDGLDGVPGTRDTGEGNGTFDQTKGRLRFFAHDGRTNFAAMDKAKRDRISVYAEGGIRDLFNFGLMAKFLAKGVAAGRTIPTASYRGFNELGMNDRAGNFVPWNNRWVTLPRDMLMLYGKENPTDDERVAGEGDHVGTYSQALDRFGVVFNWTAAAWPSLPKATVPKGGSSTTERQRTEYFQSTKLGAQWEYAIALPPGYDAPENAETRYPILYLLHGYGMDPSDFLSTALFADIQAGDPTVKFRPMIYVFPYGKCCLNGPNGARVCREKDEMGREYERLPGWSRECNQGTFWINRAGYTPADATPYGDALFELMGHIDSKYRTLAPADVEAR